MHLLPIVGALLLVVVPASWALRGSPLNLNEINYRPYQPLVRPSNADLQCKCPAGYEQFSLTIKNADNKPAIEVNGK